MTAIRIRIAADRKALLAGVALLGLGVLSGANPAGAVEVLDYCLEHRDECALSVYNLTEGWERHLNPDRLQVTGSTFKILTLIVYAEAVADGRIDPERTIAKEEWARVWIGRDGDALERSWDALGRPDRVSIDQIMRQMILESDNAAPDWLLAELGSGYFKKVLAKYVPGYHDVPASIAGAFVSWDGNPDELEVGRRILAQYSGIEALGYQKEIQSWFKRLSDEEFVRAARRISCSTLPWEDRDPSCGGPSAVGDEEIRRLLGGYFLQSTSRTYNRLLRGILDQSLLPADVQEVVVRHLEAQLEIPEASDLATRLGTKGGSLAPQNVCNYVAYVELRATGEQLVASVFLQNVPVHLDCDEDVRPFELLESLVFEDGFQEELMARLPEEVARPELIARLETLKRKTKAKGDQLKARLTVSNIGSADAEGPFEVWLVASDDAKVTRRDQTLETWVVPFLAADGSVTFRFKGKKLDALAGKYLFVRVDRGDEVPESDEDNDRPWQVLD